MPIDNLSLKWKAFGWNVINCDGHSEKSLEYAFSKIKKLDQFDNRRLQHIWIDF